METVTEMIANNSSLDYRNGSSCYKRDFVSRLVVQELWPQKCHEYVKLMLGQVFPLLALLVTVCNLTVVAVFVKPKVRSHTSFILTLIALSDILNILCPSIVYIYFYTFGNYDDPAPFHLCRLTYYMADIFKDMFNCFSLWSTVLLAYFRSRCITSPFRTCEFHTRRNTVISISIIVGLTMAVYLPSLFVFDFIPVSVTTDTGHVTNTCSVKVSEFLGRCFLRKLHLWLEALLTSILPCVLLIILNLRMLWSLRRANRNRDLLMISEQTSSKNVQPNVRRGNRKRFYSSSNQTRENPIEYMEIEVKAVVTDISKQRKEGTICKTSNSPHLNHDTTPHPVGRQTFFVFNLLNILLINRQDSEPDRDVKTERLVKSESVRSHDNAYERLNRASRRTSWCIVLVVSIIGSHELPMAIIACYTLLSTEGPLPAVIYGCNNLLLLLWQYIAYTLIFLVYFCMCSAFRSELWNSISCKRANTKTRHNDIIFISPCLVRQHLTESQSGDSQRDRVLSSNKAECLEIDEDLNVEIGV